MEQTDSWAASVAKEVGQRVAYYRTRSLDEHGRKLTTQALADRTAELGYPMDRSVLAKFEKGYRLTVTVADVVVLAAALRISPLELLLPLGQAETVEVLPDNAVSVVDAMRWLVGVAPLPGSTWDGSTKRRAIVATMENHQNAVEDWRVAVRKLQLLHDSFPPHHNAAMVESNNVVAADYQESIDRALSSLRNLRIMMRAQGATPPALPADLPPLDEGEES